MDEVIITKGITTLGQALGVETQETITEPHSLVVVKVADKAAEKAKRAKQWLLELASRMAELVAWCQSRPNSWVVRKANGVRAAVDCGVPCAYCQKLKAGTNEVQFSKDPSVMWNAVTKRHQDYHLGVALTAIHNAEWQARADARSAREKAAEERLLKGVVEEMREHRNPHRKGGRFTSPDPNGWHSGHRPNKCRTKKSQGRKR